MNRTANSHSDTLMLERLEKRTQPSILLTGVVQQQLAAPLNNMVNDMRNAAGDLNVQFQTLQIQTAPPGPLGLGNSDAEIITDKMIGDWPRILNDSAAIKATSAADVNFLHLLAFSEYQNGDLVDLAAMFYGPFLGFDPTRSLSAPVERAQSIVTDTTLTSIVNLNLHNVNSYVDSTLPNSQVTGTPLL